ncbi:MAG: hypothetical protein AAFY88_04745, partial [Acidobacteriota bacterium]
MGKLLRQRLHAALAGAASAAVAPGAVALMIAWAACAAPSRAQDGGESAEPASEGVESGEPVVLSEPAAPVVPLFDPNGSDPGVVPTYDPDAPVPLYDPEVVPGYDPEVVPGYDPDAPVPLFDPGGPGSGGSGDRGAAFDPESSLGFDDGLFVPNGDEPEWRPAGLDVDFDFAAARKLLSTQMATPDAVAAPEDVLEVVEAGEL